MTRTKIFLIAALGALLVFAIACGGALDNGNDADGIRTNSATGNIAEAPASEERDAALIESEYAINDDSGDGSIGEGTGAAPIDPQLDGVLDRKIIQTTAIDIGIEGDNGVSRSFQDIIRIAETAGGFVASSSFSNVDDRQFADVTIRVPGTEYQTVLADLRGMGDVSQESSDANDVSEEYTDLEARLRTLNATEQRYLELLAQANTINDILVVQDRLDVVRGQIEQVVGRMNLLDNLTDLATITVHLSPAVVAVDASSGGGSLTPAEAFENAWDASLDVLAAIAIGALVVVAFSWWLVPVFIVAAVGARWWAHRRPGAPASSSAS